MKKLFTRLIDKIEFYLKAYYIKKFKKKVIPVGTVCILTNHRWKSTHPFSPFVTIRGYVCEPVNEIPTLVLLELVNPEKESLPQPIVEDPEFLCIFDLLDENLNRIYFNLGKDCYFTTVERMLNRDLVVVEKQPVTLSFKFLKK